MSRNKQGIKFKLNSVGKINGFDKNNPYIEAIKVKKDKRSIE